MSTISPSCLKIIEIIFISVVNKIYFGSGQFYVTSCVLYIFFYIQILKRYFSNNFTDVKMKKKNNFMDGKRYRAKMLAHF